MSDVYLVLEAMFYREKQRLGDPGSKTVQLTQSCYRGEGIERKEVSRTLSIISLTLKGDIIPTSQDYFGE